MLRHLPNVITALRIVLVIPLCWLVVTGRYESALLVATVAGFSDALDGFLAKHFGWTSWIGGMLDPVADKLMLTAAFVTLAWVGGLPMWLAVLVVGRDLLIVAGAVAYHRLVGRFDAAPSRLSKLTTAVQIVFVLLTLLHQSRWIVLAPWMQSILVAIVAVITILSGLQYVFIWGLRAARTRKESRT